MGSPVTRPAVGGRRTAGWSRRQKLAAVVSLQRPLERSVSIRAGQTQPTTRWKFH